MGSQSLDRAKGVPPSVGQFAKLDSVMIGTIAFVYFKGRLEAIGGSKNARQSALEAVEITLIVESNPDGVTRLKRWLVTQREKSYRSTMCRVGGWRRRNVVQRVEAVLPLLLVSCPGLGIVR